MGVESGSLLKAVLQVRSNLQESRFVSMHRLGPVAMLAFRSFGAYADSAYVRSIA